MVTKMQRSFEEIKARSKAILNDEIVINLVKKSSSPTAAFEMILAETKDQVKAKAGRWLAILARDYPEEYVEIISSQVKLPKHYTEEINNEKLVHQTDLPS